MLCRNCLGSKSLYVVQILIKFLLGLFTPLPSNKKVLARSNLDGVVYFS